MDGANDELTVDADGVRDPPPRCSCGYAVGDCACGGVVTEPSDSMAEAGADMAHQPPQSSTTRTRSQNAGSSSLDPLDGGERGGYSANEEVVNAF